MKVLIVGGGLSGICLAHHFLDAQHTVKMINGFPNESSKIAAGMVNPMTFRKMVKSWRADELFPFLNAFYPQLERKVNEKFFYSLPIRRVFSTPEEKELWKKRQKEGEYADFVSRKEIKAPDYIIEKEGSGRVLGASFIAAKKFVDTNINYLKNHVDFVEEPFDFENYKAEQKSYKKEAYDCVLFAEGYRLLFNPLFNYLPLRHTKGEVLTVQSNELEKNEIINRKCFVLPIEKNFFKLGATFAWNTTDSATTDEAKETLLQQYSAISTAAITVTHQEGGIRPTVADRRPLIGEHPEHKGNFVFNGMGTKGYMLAPFFSKQLFDHITKNKELDETVNIERFFKKFWV